MSDMSGQINQDRHPVSDTSGATPIAPIMLTAADFGLLDPADAHYGPISTAQQGELSSLGGATA